MQKKSNLYVITLVFIPFMFAYLLSELYRNVNGIIGPVLKTELNLSAESLGFMTSMFLAAVAGSQIFTGILLDRYGARRTVSFLLFIGAVGALLFSTGIYANLLIGRFLIGVGMAGCWTAAFKVNADWWPPERLAMANGAIIGLAGLGSLAATLPTQMLLGVISWNTVFIWLACLTVAVSVALLLIVPETNKKTIDSHKPRFLDELRGFLVVLKNPVFIRIAPISILCQGVWLSYQGLWAGVWLQEVNGLQAVSAAYYLFILAACVVTGNLILSVLADKLSKHGISLYRTMYWLCSIFVVAQAVIVFNSIVHSAYLWGVFGLFLAGPIFAYALISQAVPSNFSGRAVSLLNLFSTLVGFAMQYSVGVVIELWLPSPNGIYPIIAHQTAFGIIILCQIMALFWMIYSKGSSRSGTKPINASI